MKILYKGFNYSQDGPGNRLVFHMQGCNFQCKWCANPESIPMQNPKNMIYTPQQLCAESLRCKPMFFDGGGVTFTGGEPTLQFDELLQTLQLLKNENIHTAIETNGSHSKLTQLSTYIDFFIIDLKHFDARLHKQWTGVENEQTKINIQKLLQLRNQLLIRIPLVNGVNYDSTGFISFFQSIQEIEKAQIEILPYHEYGKEKWTETYEIENGFITNDLVEQFTQALCKSGLQVVNT